jgi:hypothetical protein
MHLHLESNGDHSVMTLQETVCLEFMTARTSLLHHLTFRGSMYLQQASQDVPELALVEDIRNPENTATNRGQQKHSRFSMLLKKQSLPGPSWLQTQTECCLSAMPPHLR